MNDRAQQALHLLGLDPVSETIADGHSYGFRKNRSTADAIEQVFNCLCLKQSGCWVLEGDIQGCFDHIDFDWLLSHIPMDKGVLSRWLHAGYIERNTFHKTRKGTPQGGIASPCLANMTLDGMEALIKQLGKAHGIKVHFVRYADDFVIISHSKAFLEQVIKPAITAFLKRRGLTLSDEKTRLTHIEEGFDFLGQSIRKYNGKLLIKPSVKNTKRFLDKIRETVKSNPQAKTSVLISQLNPMIRGWANYHRHVVSKKAFARVDHQISHCLWRWAKRRHPRKSRQWIKAKYFKIKGKDHWRFAGENENKEMIYLRKAAETPIKRHVKIRAKANPYDPEWEPYFEKRLTVQWVAGWKFSKIKTLWRRQEGICPVCRQRIDGVYGFDVHHIVRRCDGGSDCLDNLVLLHPNCHNQVHSTRSDVLPPVNEKRL